MAELPLSSGKCRVCGGNATALVNVAPDAASGGSMEPVCSDHMPDRYKTVSMYDHKAALAKCRKETVVECAKVAKEIAECKYEEARNSRDRGQHPDVTVYIGQHACALKIEREIHALTPTESGKPSE